MRAAGTAPVRTCVRRDTHFKVIRARIRLYLPRATCVTFIAAHTVRAIMLGRRKRHGGTISLSTGVGREPGGSRKLD